MNVLIITLLYIASSAWATAQVVQASALRPAVQPRSVAGGRGSGPEYGSVRRVVDGDTYEVLLPAGLVRLRLLRVDAPELSQPYGRQAAALVAELLRGRLLEVSQSGATTYDRALAGLRVAIPASGGARRWLRVDSLLVARGWAWAYAPGQATPDLAGLQELARRHRRGLWQCGTATVVRPGVWRAYNKQEKARAWVGCSGWPRE